MRVRFASTALIAMLLLGACGAKRPAAMPPAPSSSGGEGIDGAQDGGAGSVVRGSRADFIAQAGSDTVHFATDMHMLEPSETAILDAQARWLARYPAQSVTIEGHCDERGTREYNLGLGERRANAVKNYLANRGIAPARMSVISYGKERPVATGSDESAWAENRRAVTVLLGGEGQ